MKNKADFKIVVLQRGWVLVGKYSEKGDRGYLDGASVIRRWGTEKVLGQLVNGPTTEGKSCAVFARHYHPDAGRGG